MDRVRRPGVRLIVGFVRPPTPMLLQLQDFGASLWQLNHHVTR
jgi:hypothetical protein